MSRRPKNAPRRSRNPQETRANGRPGRRVVAIALGVVLVAGLAVALGWAWWSRRPAALVARAEAASRDGDRVGTLVAWREVNRTDLANARTWLAEARAALALGRAAEAIQALRRSLQLDPAAAEPWRLILEIYRVEDRATDALREGWEAYGQVAPSGRRGVLRDLTLALLADLPDDVSRDTLARWAAGGDAEGPQRVADTDARAALLQRMNTMPRAGDLPRADRIAELTAMLAADPGHLVAREALLTALADAGETERGRDVLAGWPEDRRDARYWRLLGRWELEYDRRPDQAATAFTRAIEELPHDWKTRVRLARALRALGRDEDARRQAEAVARLRERLDPGVLGPRLTAALESTGRGAEGLSGVDPSRQGGPAAPSANAPLADLALLCEQVGLAKLAEAWRRESASFR